MSDPSTDDQMIAVTWLDPGVTTGICLYSRSSCGTEWLHFNQTTGLAQTARYVEEHMDNMMYFENKYIGYESFYIGDRTLKASTNNVRQATHIIGWLETQSVLNRLGGCQLVQQSPSQRGKKILQADIVDAVLDKEPTTGMRHAYDAARHLVMWMIHDRKDPLFTKRFQEAKRRARETGVRP